MTVASGPNCGLTVEQTSARFKFDYRALASRFLACAVHAPAMYHKHLLIEPLISIQGDTATVHSMFSRLDRYPEGPGIRALGRYRDTLVRCPDGRWRFTERLPEIEAVRAQAPLGGEPFPDSAAMRQRWRASSPSRPTHDRGCPAPQ